jgi:hypothetical protein
MGIDAIGAVVCSARALWAEAKSYDEAERVKCRKVCRSDLGALVITPRASVLPA